MHILVFLLVIVVAVFVMGLAAIGNIIRTIFGLGRRTTNSANGQQRRTYQSSQQHTSQNQKAESDNGQSNKKPGKVFTEDEGEYVDFEEFKD